MGNEILWTKLQRPPMAPDVVPRQALLDRLVGGQQRVLTLVSAPAGYGKSTLASLWLDVCGCPGIWISLDEQDADLRQFLSYLGAALKAEFPGSTFQVDDVLDAERLPPAPVLARRLLNDLEALPERFVLVLDDYQRVRGSGSVNELISALLDHPTRNMHLVLLTRRDPVLQIARLRGLGQVTEVRARDLRLNLDEASAFLGNLNVHMDTKAVSLLNEKAEGWAAGLRLAGLYLCAEDDPAACVERLGGSSYNVAEYLFAEVLSRQSDEVVSGLMQASLLDRFCVPLCQALQGPGSDPLEGLVPFQTTTLLNWLVETNLFIVPLDGEGYWYRFHHLFQSFLQAQLLRKVGAPGAARLHRRASEWLAENGWIDEALRHALAAGDTDLATRLVISHRNELLSQSQFARLSKWLRQLPPGAGAGTPLLLTTKALVGLVYGPHSDAFDGTEEASRVASEARPEDRDFWQLVGEVAVLRSCLNILMGQPAHALAQAQEALRILPRQALFARSLAIGAVAGSRQMDGQGAAGIAFLKASLADPAWSAAIRIRMWFYLCIVAFMEADASELLLAARECLRLTGRHFMHPRNNTLYYVGALHYLRDELDAADTCLSEVIENHEVSQVSYVAHASALLAFVRLAKGDADGAWRVLDLPVGSPWLEQDEYAMAVWETLPAEIALRDGRLSEARRLAQGVNFDRCPPHWYLFVPQLTAVRILLAEGTEGALNEGRARLLELDARMRTLNRRNVQLPTLALLAVVESRLQDEEAALQCLGQAIEMGRPSGFVRPFVDLGLPMLHLVERSLELRPEDEYLRVVVEACRSAEGESSVPGTDAILSPREIELLSRLATGLSNKELAAGLGITPDTVKTHLQHIYRKLGARGRIPAVNKARSLGLIPGAQATTRTTRPPDHSKG